jgi:hypothetical protein
MNALMSSLRKKTKVSLKAIREILYGFTTYELHRGLQRDKGAISKLFVLMIFGDLVGLPLLPPYYAMRLLPYMIPHINAWKRSVLKEKDLTEILVE